MEGQHGYIPPTESETGDSKPPEFNQTGFQEVEPSTSPSFNSEGFSQGGFKPANADSSKDFQQTGFQPQQTGFQPQQTGFQPQQTGFQPQQTGYQPLPAQQKTTISNEKFHEIENAVKAAKDALDKAHSMIQEIAFTPQPSGAFDGF